MREPPPGCSMLINGAFLRPPAYAGHWIIPGGGCHFSTYHRPNWFHRLANRVLLGWKWERQQ